MSLSIKCYSKFTKDIDLDYWQKERKLHNIYMYRSLIKASLKFDEPVLWLFIL